MRAISGCSQTLGGFPRSGLGGANQGVDDCHVADGILQRIWNFGVFPDGFRKQVRLNRKLITDRKRFSDLTAGSVEVLAIINVDAGWLIGGSVERDFDVNAALGAEELHPLVVDELRRTGEDALPGRIFEDSRGEAVSLETGVALDAGEHARRLLSENKARRFDRITADIHECAAGHVDHVASVRRVDIEIAEKAKGGMQFADSPGADELARADPLRMRADHEGFSNFHTVLIARFEELPGLGDRAANGFLT